MVITISPLNVSDDVRLEVLSESPDSRWQLALEPDGAIWLVSKDEMVKLHEYVPYASQWRWADDSSMLWFEHPHIEFGSEAVLVHLGDPLTVTVPEPVGYLDPTYYQIAVSPQKTALAVERDAVRADIPRNVLYHHDLTSGSGATPVLTETVPGLLTVDWDWGTGTHLLVTAANSELQIRAEDEITILAIDRVEIHLPLTLFTDLINNATHAQAIMISILSDARYALSPSGDRLAHVGSDGVTYVFDCSNGG
jgi:hypothetical protein